MTNEEYVAARESAQAAFKTLYSKALCEYLDSNGDDFAKERYSSVSEAAANAYYATVECLREALDTAGIMVL